MILKLKLCETNTVLHSTTVPYYKISQVQLETESEKSAGDAASFGLDNGTIPIDTMGPHHQGELESPIGIRVGALALYHNQMCLEHLY